MKGNYLMLFHEQTFIGTCSLLTSMYKKVILFRDSMNSERLKG